MSDVLTGDPTHITTPLTATVTALTNNGAGAIRVTTAPAHLFGDQDTVLMAAPPAAGLFKITVVDATHFDLQGSTFTTTGSGSAVDYSITPQVQVPTDGDPQSAQLSGLLSSMQAVLDRTQYLNRKVPFVERTSVVATSTVLVPPDCYFIVAELIGGGGGGEGGKRGEHALGGGSGGVLPQGGAGAAAPLVTIAFAVTPGEELTVTIGAAGAGGAAGGGAGGDGTATTITRASGEIVAYAEGACGCGTGLENWGGATYQAVAQYLASLTGYTDTLGAIAPGAIGVATGVAKPFPYSTGPLLNNFVGYPGSPTKWGARFERAMPRRGGSVGVVWGTASTPGYIMQVGGTPESQLEFASGAVPIAGGTPGSAGTTDGTAGTAYAGGCGGGGGGSSAFGQGGTGGNGGNGNHSGVGGNATAGSAPGGTAYGAGGGGGGCGGDGSTAGGTSAAGGPGMTGFAALYMVLPAKVTP